jgi:hypothetical protein
MSEDSQRFTTQRHKLETRSKSSMRDVILATHAINGKELYLQVLSLSVKRSTKILGD